jgi:cell filamentation protein
MDRVYCYPNTHVLINKFNVRDLETLNTIEREYSSRRIFEMKATPPKGIFDAKHLRDIHKHIFQDVYPWAGKFRTVDIAKGTLFCPPQNLDNYLDNVLGGLRNENYLLGADLNKFASRMGYYFAEINAVHPFREGNGRAQRTFSEQLGKIAGFNVDFSKVSEKEMLEASVYSANVDETKLVGIFKKISTPITDEERLVCANMILPERSNILKIVRSQCEESIKAGETALVGIGLDDTMNNIKNFKDTLSKALPADSSLEGKFKNSKGDRG